MSEKGRKAGKRAFPEDLGEWRHVDKAARYWALRHYTDESGFGEYGTAWKATGLVFTLDPGRGAGRGERVKMTSLSTVEKPLKQIALEWRCPEERTWKPRVKRVGPGVAEITAELKREGEAVRFLFMLLYHLGHAIAC